MTGDTVIIQNRWKEKLWYLLKNVGIWTADTQYLAKVGHGPRPKSVTWLKLWLEVDIWVLHWAVILYLHEVAMWLTDPK